MTGRRSTNLTAAYDLLLQEMQTQIDRVNSTGGQAFVSGDHARASELLANAKKLISLRDELIAWGGTLRSLLHEAEPETVPASPEDVLKRLQEALFGSGPTPPTTAVHQPPGPATPEGAYRVPMLRILVEMGGSARAAAVLDQLERVLGARFTPYDLSPVPSDNRTPHWRVAARWCRNTLREEGLLKPDSPRGVWEISQEGRRWLAAQNQQP